MGVAPGADLYAVKVLNRSGFGWLSDIIAGLEWSVENDMQVANMSIGGGGNESYHAAIKAAHGAGIVIVAAAGNDGEDCASDDCVNYPAAYPETIAAAASDSGDAIAAFSSRGPQVDITGPGVAVPSTWKGGGYREGSGTSMATPHVTGVVALVIEAKGSLAPDAVKSLLKGTAERLDDYSALQQGAGLVDAEAALR